mmetsp:Transcript_37403/g.64266  ORF Transcript_37403/g.64266 Transcript_37403/m.64266 type:complete len:191 (+) Transcript_37403:33-605(+)
MFSSLVQRVKSFNDLTRNDSAGDLIGKVTESEMKRVGSNPDMDPSVEPNKNIAWVRGEALITFYLGILVFCRLLLWILNFSPHTSWTIINVAHCIITFPFLHWVKGSPFSGLWNDQGIYEKFTFWEQLDRGAQFTTTKKFLTIIPILIYCLTIRFDFRSFEFIINTIAFLIVLIGKSPQMHKVRLFGINS